MGRVISRQIRVGSEKKQWGCAGYDLNCLYFETPPQTTSFKSLPHLSESAGNLSKMILCETLVPGYCRVRAIQCGLSEATFARKAAFFLMFAAFYATFGLCRMPHWVCHNGICLVLGLLCCHNVIIICTLIRFSFVLK